MQHFLSLPIFLFFIPDIKKGFAGLAPSSDPTTVFAQRSLLNTLTPYLVLLANLFTQLLCVSGVNQLTSVRPISFVLEFVTHALIDSLLDAARYICDDQPGTDHTQSYQLMLQCLVVRQRLECPAWRWSGDGFPRVSSIPPHQLEYAKSRDDEAKLEAACQNRIDLLSHLSSHFITSIVL